MKLKECVWCLSSPRGDVQKVVFWVTDEELNNFAHILQFCNFGKLLCNVKTTGEDIDLTNCVVQTQS